jgi:phosphatidylglycerophosphate synthase
VPSIYDLKPRFQALLRPAMRALASAGVTPNMVTLAAVLGSVAAGIGVTKASEREEWLLILPVWLFLRMGLNAIDGMMARELNRATRLGAVLNEVGDVVSDVALYLPLAIVMVDVHWAIVTFCFTAVMTEFCGILAQALGAGRQYAGPMGKSDRAFLVGALVLISWIWPPVYAAWHDIFWVATGLAAWTCLRRLAVVVKVAK